MAFDLATARTRLTTSPGDAIIQVGIDTAIAVAERYCDRNFLYKSETARFYYYTGEALHLPRYPIEQVASTTGMNNATYKVHHTSGQLEFAGQVHFEEATVTYAGGYRVLPADLELALWLIFDNVMASLDPAAGGASVGGVGAITSISVPDVGTIRMDVGGAAASAATGGAAFGMIPAYSVALLDPYRYMKA